MRKGLFAICLVLVVAIVLLVVFVPSCIPTTGTITVQATLCDVLWQSDWLGEVNYTLTSKESTITGNSVPHPFTVNPGNWTCEYISGGPPGAHLVDSITPSATQEVSEGGDITFTLHFELDQDAWIEFLTWTVSGDPVGEPGEPVYVEAGPCQIIDAHFQQGVNGCRGYAVNVTETSWLNITQTAGLSPVQIYVVNDGWAVSKMGVPTPMKRSQVPSFNGTPVENGASINLTLAEPTLLDVETGWQLLKNIDYTKTINWFGISKAPYVPGVHPGVLFELVLPPGPVQSYTFILQTSASVALVDDEDVDTNNDYAESAPLFLTVTG